MKTTLIFCSIYTGEGNINVGPLFVEAASGNYHLSTESPCIDSGTPALEGDPPMPTAPSEDLDGIERPRDGDGDTIDEYDMGVYEYEF